MQRGITEGRERVLEMAEICVIKFVDGPVSALIMECYGTRGGAVFFLSLQHFCFFLGFNTLLASLRYEVLQQGHLIQEGAVNLFYIFVHHYSN